MTELRNPVVQLRQFGGPEGLQIVDAPMPKAGPGEVRVRVLASGIEYTDVTIRRRLYPWVWRKPPFVMGYGVVGEIDQIGKDVRGFRVGDRVADMTVLGSNAAYRNLWAHRLTRVPDGVDAADAAAVVLSWTTAYQMLHRTAHVQPGQRILVQGAAGAVGQALVVLGKMAGVEVWGTARAAHASVVRALGATPIDYQHEDVTRVVPDGFDFVFDGVGEDGFRRSIAALGRGGQLVAYGYVAGVHSEHPVRSLLGWMARVYATKWRSDGKRGSGYSINVMRAIHPSWFKEDLAKLFGMLAAGAIRPRVAERIAFDDVIDAHRRLEEGGLEGKLVLCPELGLRRERADRAREVHAHPTH